MKKKCEIEASEKWYAENVTEAPVDRAVVRLAKILKCNDFVAVPFHNGTRFCVMKRQSYHKTEILDFSQFQVFVSSRDDAPPKIEKAINSAWLDMKRRSLLSKKNKITFN